MFQFYDELDNTGFFDSWDNWKTYIPFYDAYELWANGSDYILSEGYERSKETGVGILEPLPFGGVLRQIPLVSWAVSFVPRIYVFSGTKSNLEAVAEYGEHVKDSKAREPHERVRQATEATTIVNLLGDAAKQEKQKIRANLSSKRALECAKELGATVSEIWDDQLSLQDNVTYIGATLIGRSFLGIQEFPREYVPLIREANDLIADGNATSNEFAQMKAKMLAMSDVILAKEAKKILEDKKGYVLTQFQFDEKESSEAAVAKLISSHGGAGFLVESNLSFILMVAMAYISSSPSIYERLYKEIQSVGELSTQSFKDLEYLDCIYRETIRFASPTAVVPRVASVTSTMNVENKNKEKSTCTIYPNSYLFFAIRSTHHDPELWPNPHLFDPLRFMPVVKERKMHFMGENYFPFSGGKRACPAGTTFVESAFKGFIFELFKNHTLGIEKQLEHIPSFAVHPRWKEDYFVQLNTNSTLENDCESLSEHSGPCKG
ncbi:cytochrome P450 [uncultured Legionella sp.]|uniref:cytochrome P450 n=1 Tax=uncultured Legionella sp. TaxID=210934 RepID=UPI002605521B|nr:cytochrome P450 [uncultured Legionella sp.]